MMGLGILSAFALYLVISILVVRIAARAAKKRGRSPLRWGAAAALVMYLLVFWDHVPTLLVHWYYCKEEAGIWVYKTPDQWKKNNPGVIENLPMPGPSGSRSKWEEFDGGSGIANTYSLNERFNWIVKKQDISNLLPIIRKEQLVNDVTRNETLARYVDFSTGNSVKNTKSCLYFFFTAAQAVALALASSPLY